jgi:hypothetical protein
MSWVTATSRFAMFFAVSVAGFETSVEFPLGFVPRGQGLRVANQPWIPAGEQSGLLAHIAMMESGSSADEKLTAFLELQRAIHEFAVSLIV